MVARRVYISSPYFPIFVLLLSFLLHISTCIYPYSHTVLCLCVLSVMFILLYMAMAAAVPLRFSFFPNSVPVRHSPAKLPL